MKKGNAEQGTDTATEANDLDLNSATEEQLAALSALGPRMAEIIVRNRPFDSWAELRRIPGFSAGIILELQSGGTRLGEPGEI